MSLTVGTGPFSRTPGGSFNFRREGPRSTILVERSPRRVRGYLGDELVVDSRDVRFLHETGHLPVWYFPREDVRAELLEPSATQSHCPFKGDASYHHLRVGDRIVEDAVWYYPEPLAGVEAIDGLVAFYFRKLDRWLEEDEEVVVHPRDPYHRVDVLPTSRHVQVSLDGELLADTRRAMVLFETSLPPRWYIPAEDVRMDLLEPSDSRTGCAYKGFARYWSARVGDRIAEDVVWSYAEPRRDAEPVRDLLCFYNEHVDLDVDGERQERPQTQWSHRATAASR